MVEGGEKKAGYRLSKSEAEVVSTLSPLSVAGDVIESMFDFGL